MAQHVERARRGEERGATALEFALCVMVLLTVVFGIIEFARAVWIQQAVRGEPRGQSLRDRQREHLWRPPVPRLRRDPGGGKVEGARPAAHRR
jgi:Flp pilus assembly pilin Flp